jgi:twitching motility protein PilJ
MSASDKSGQLPRLRLATQVFTGLVIFFLLAAGVVFGYVWYWSAPDREATRRAEAVRLLSQTIAKNASEAANGQQDAFSLLDVSQERLVGHLKVLREGNPDTRLTPPEGLPAAESSGVLQDLSELESVWQGVKANVTDILERRDQIIAVNRVAEKFDKSVPQLQRMTDALVERLKAIDATPSQVDQAVRLQLLGERIARNLDEMLRGGLGNRTAQGRLARATEDLSQALNGLRTGSAQLGVGAVSNEAAREQLARISAHFNNMSSDLTNVQQTAQQLFRVRDAADEIFIASDRLEERADTLATQFRGLAGQRLLQEWWGFLFGGLAIVFLVIRGLLARRINTIEVAAAEAERADADAQRERNQQAILNLLDEIEGLREGDLSVSATVGEEITGAIADAFNDSIDSLRNLARTINETSVQVSSAAQETQATARHLAEASDHQAHQITAASAAVNEMAVSIEQVSRNAEESANVAQQAVDLAVKGAETVNATIEQMDSIREQIQETSKRIKRLGESSQEIGNIVELINDIADQTNILALNASIQAAMAGESGRGFAVVADEVQRLAERSGNATKQIEALVKTIQTDTNEAVISMEQSTSGVVAGAKQAEEAGEALREIESVSKQLAGLIQNISEASRQQANAASNVSDTMNVIQEITSQTSAGTNETATSIGNLADLANQLRESVAGFKLPEQEE